MRRFALMFALIGLSAQAHAAPHASDAWAPPSLVGSTVGVAYLTIESTSDDALIAVTSPRAARIELHTHIHEKGVLRMRKLEAVPLPAGEQVTLAPRGLHLMLYQLRTPLTEGETLPLVLQFKHSPPLKVEAQISRAKLLEFLAR